MVRSASGVTRISAPLTRPLEATRASSQCASTSTMAEPTVTTSSLVGEPSMKRDASARTAEGGQCGRAPDRTSGPLRRPINPKPGRETTKKWSFRAQTSPPGPDATPERLGRDLFLALVQGGDEVVVGPGEGV